MALIVVVEHGHRLDAAARVATLRARGHEVYVADADDEALAERVARAELVVVGELAGCPRELALTAWLTGHARRLVYAPATRPACASAWPTEPSCPTRPECERCDRHAVLTALTARADGVVEPTSRAAALQQAVADVLAQPERPPLVSASRRRRYWIWGHALGVGDSISLLPMAHALARHCEHPPALVVPRHHAALLQPAWPQPLLPHEGFDPRTLPADAIILEITVGQNARHVGRLAARLVHLDLARQAGGDGLVHERLLGLLAHAGIGACVPAPRIPVPPAELEHATRRLAAHGLRSRERLVAVHPGTSRAEKRWPAERFSALIAGIRAELRAEVLLLLGPGESGQSTAMADASFVSDGDPLREVAALVHGCRAFVGNDSGLAHLAAAVGVPTVTIAGPMSPRIWRPAHPRGRVVDRGGDVLAVEPSQVLAVLRPLLEERAA